MTMWGVGSAPGVTDHQRITARSGQGTLHCELLQSSPIREPHLRALPPGVSTHSYGRFAALQLSSLETWEEDQGTNILTWLIFLPFVYHKRWGNREGWWWGRTSLDCLLLSEAHQHLWGSKIARKSRLSYPLSRLCGTIWDKGSAGHTGAVCSL